MFVGVVVVPFTPTGVDRSVALRKLDGGMYVKYIHRVEYRAKLFLGSALNIGPPILPPETKHQGPEWLAPSLCENNILWEAVGNRASFALSGAGLGRTISHDGATTTTTRAGRAGGQSAREPGGRDRARRKNKQPTNHLDDWSGRGSRQTTIPHDDKPTTKFLVGGRAWGMCFF